jgi:GTP-binding protein EngB required for normal cell division
MKSDSKTADRFRIAVLGHSNVGKSGDDRAQKQNLNNSRPN